MEAIVIPAKVTEGFAETSQESKDFCDFSILKEGRWSD